jgi:hypothetical protein
MIKSQAQYWAETSPRLQPTGVGGLPRTVSQKSRLGHGLAARPSKSTSLRGLLQRAHGTARWSARRRLGGGSTAEGAAVEHQWGPGVVPGKKIGGGAHPIGGASGGQWDGAARWRSTAVERAQWWPTTRP